MAIHIREIEKCLQQTEMFPKELILRGPQNMTFHGTTVSSPETEGYL